MKRFPQSPLVALQLAIISSLTAAAPANPPVFLYPIQETSTPATQSSASKEDSVKSGDPVKALSAPNTTSSTTVPQATPQTSQAIPQTTPTVTPTQNAPVIEQETPQGIQEFSNPAESPAEAVKKAKQSLVPSPEIEIVSPSEGNGEKTILINFNNIGMVELIRFISKVTNKNFLFDENELQFNVTILSEEPTSVENVMTALLQELRIHGLSMLEQGNSIIIHTNPKVTGISKVVGDDGIILPPNAEIATQVFQLNTVQAENVAVILKPLLSDVALIEVLAHTNHLIVTDLSYNLVKVAELVKSIDAPKSALVIGQYAVAGTSISALVDLAQQIMLPISQDQPLIFVQSPSSRSIFIISTPFIVERTIAILEKLDSNESRTGIYKLGDLVPETLLSGQSNAYWMLGPDGKWIFKADATPAGESTPEGKWMIGPNGQWQFVPTGTQLKDGLSEPTDGASPNGSWVKDANGKWVFEMNHGETTTVQKLSRPVKTTADLPVGHIDKTEFYIHKLRYRKGDTIQIALQKIAQSLQSSGTGNTDLIATIDSVQWIDSSNALVFTGTQESIAKVKDLIAEIDSPLRQVFIEMLILDVTISDSLEFGVNFGSRFGGGDYSGSQAFTTTNLGNNLLAGLNTTGYGTNGTVIQTPNAANMNTIGGYTLGIVGQEVSFNGVFFRSIGALVKALHDRRQSNIIMNPKILTEDNYPAEVFVGLNIPFPTQSFISPSAIGTGTIVTQNFEYRDVGTTFKVTPILSGEDMITMEIVEEVSSVDATVIFSQQAGPTTKKSKTTTKVHVPNNYFVVMSGMIQDQNVKQRSQIPCLGSLPILGGLASDKNDTDDKRNIMIFINPQIIDSEEEMDGLTRRQQDIFKQKQRMKPSALLEADEALDFLNIRPQLPREADCLY